MEDKGNELKPAGTGRQDILEVARGLFMTRGYRAVSTRDIAVAVGLTQPALYHHFGNKEDLYITVLEDELARLAHALWTAVRLELPAIERLRAVALVIVERAEYDLSQMFHDLRFEISPQNRQRVRRVFQASMLEPVLSVLDAMVDEGTIEPPEQLGLTRHEGAMFVLMVIRMLTQPGPTTGGHRRTRSELADTTVRLVVSGMGFRTTR